MPAAQLFLITPVLDLADAFVAPLTAALEAAEVASVLVRIAPDRDGRAVATIVVPLIQAHGAAALLAEDTETAVAADADGVHVARSARALPAAIRRLKPDRIVGAGGLAMRDDAMVAGEAGADYLLFGDDEAASLAERCERVAWWAEMFEVPCVAMAHRLVEVEVLAASGAEFIALGDAVWSDPRGPAAAIRDAGATLERVAGRLAAEAG